MSRLSQTIAAFLAAATLSLELPAQATWYVDDDGGSGVDFLDIQSAVCAAAAGDLVRVAPGTYPGFVTRTSIRILGDPGAVVAGTTHVLVVTDPQPFVLAGLLTHGLELAGCSSTVLLMDLTIEGDVRIMSCPDVRAHALRSGPAGASLDVRSSRLELLRSNIVGQVGATGDSCGAAGGFGSVGLEIADARLHLALSDLAGGNGGEGYTTVCSSACAGEGGQGGTGLHGHNADITLSGDGTSALRGGDGGAGCPFGGPHGASFGLSSSTLRHSGYSFPDPISVLLTSQSTPAQNPTVEVLGTMLPGAPIEVVLRGTAGELISLELGRTPVLATGTGSWIETLISPGRRISLGVTPPNGELRLALTIPPSWPTGTLVWLQASATDGTGPDQRSNSAAILVR